MLTRKDQNAKRELIREALNIITGSEIAQSVILEGGGALSFAYGSPRYPSDLDFVDLTIDSIGAAAYANKLDEVGKRKYPVTNIKVTNSGRGVRAKWSFYEGGPAVKIEVEARDVIGPTQLSREYGVLQVKKPIEIYADKVVANLSRIQERRESTALPIKPADLIDMDYIGFFLNVTPSLEDIKRKAKRWNIENLVTAENLEEIAGIIKNENNHDKIRKCMVDSLPPNVYLGKNFDSVAITRMARHFEQYVHTT